MENSKIKVKTTYWSDSIIQETQLYQGDTLLRVVSQNILELKESGTREALINLGWTPPKDK